MLRVNPWKEHLMMKLGEPERIWAIGAHPDDIEIGCGGTLANYLSTSKDSEVRATVLSRGENGGSKSERFEEALRSAQILGISRSSLDILEFHDGEFYTDQAQVIKTIETISNEFQPTVVFTHSDTRGEHQDHAVANLATLIATRDQPCHVFLYENYSTPATFTPRVFSDITDTYPLKASAIEAHASQKIPLELVRSRAVIRGNQMCRWSKRNRLAEAFDVHKFII
jgi:LmbE family N-acetylglucosaminyl deacetylase